MTGVKYDDSGLTGERFIILSDIEQQMPAGNLVVVGSETRTNAAKKEYPVLLVEDENGNRYSIAAWKRDVRRCILEWGGDVDAWVTQHLTVRIAPNESKTRYELYPTGMLATEEHVTTLSEPTKDTKVYVAENGRIKTPPVGIIHGART